MAFHTPSHVSPETSAARQGKTPAPSPHVWVLCFEVLVRPVPGCSPLISICGVGPKGFPFVSTKVGLTRPYQALSASLGLADSLTCRILFPWPLRSKEWLHSPNELHSSFRPQLACHFLLTPSDVLIIAHLSCHC